MARDKIVGIYRITNTVLNVSYIGSSTNILRRFSDHNSNLKYNKHENKLLQLDYNFYGEFVFEFEIIKVIENIEDKKKLNEQLSTLENYYICLYNAEINGYNLKSKTKRIYTNKNLYSKHNLSNSRIYRIWCNMKSRCYTKSSSSYELYGGRGIKVCDAWKNSFECFYNDMIETYADNLSLDRIDNNKDYCLENCKWSTPIEQARNRRSCKKIKYKDKVISLIEYCEVMGKNYKSELVKSYKLRNNITYKRKDVSDYKVNNGKFKVKYRVSKYDLDGNCIKIYNSVKECASDNNMKIETTRSYCKNNRKNRGFILKLEYGV